MKEQVPSLPLLSLAVHTTGVVPFKNRVPEGGAHVTDAIPQVSDALAENVTGASQCPAANLQKNGELVEQTSDSIKLKVKRDRVVPVCKALLDELPVQDLDIEEVPIEDVIRSIFAR